MKLLIRHQTAYYYGAGSSRATMLLRLRPRSHAGQNVQSWQLSVNGDPVTNVTPNGYGDLESLWVSHDRLDAITIVAEGTVETVDTHGVLSGLAERADSRMFLRETPLTTPTEALRSFAADIGGGETDTLSRLHALSAGIVAEVPYRAGITNADTSAGEAFALGGGVCQDHAQIFIAAARSMGVPARYVTGYLLAQEGDNPLHETHGWAEALVPGLGWIGFDASNQMCVTNHYVRIACGLDAIDAAPVRGLVTAAGDIAIDADVRIAQASDDEGERQLQRQQQQSQSQDGTGAGIESRTGE
ncbi:transglutaminase family protein [Sphingobium sp. H39-3-25]|uniref:transglutaminase family protein n=1 Tax=Sphingobium arseniciresistens TaxID=3030834 RepID=UPI0023B8E097|nr:transglutaminase family protein [Sphingobium arseniciresistens]